MSVVYGSLTTAIVVLFSLEIAATLLLLGAQVIAEYERIGKGEADTPPAPLRIEAVASDAAQASSGSRLDEKRRPGNE